MNLFLRILRLPLKGGKGLGNKGSNAEGDLNIAITLFFIGIDGSIERQMGTMPFDMLRAKAEALVEK